MITLESITAPNNFKNIIFIPGGPGLSSSYMRILEPLKEHMNLHFVDIYKNKQSEFVPKKFETICEELIDAIHSIDGYKICLGHSFGGFFAAKLFLDDHVDSLVCVSVPFSTKTLNAVNNQYNLYCNSELKAKELNWINNPSNETFRDWLGNYDKLYFFNNRNKEYILGDNTCYEFFLNNRGDAKKFSDFLDKIKIKDGKKLFFAGEDDLLIPINLLMNECSQANGKFIPINNSSHFVFLDNPEKFMNYLRLEYKDIP